MRKKEGWWSDPEKKRLTIFLAKNSSWQDQAARLLLEKANPTAHIALYAVQFHIFSVSGPKRKHSKHSGHIEYFSKDTMYTPHHIHCTLQITKCISAPKILFVVRLLHYCVSTLSGPSILLDILINSFLLSHPFLCLLSQK